MAFQEIIRELEATRGDIHAQSVITAEFAVAMQKESFRERFRAALDAAAVLRWFDVPLLATLLEIGEAEALERFDALAGLPFVEHFPSRAGDVRNVHDATRLGWRRRLSKDEPESFRTLSARAATFFRQDASPAARIEWIYHLLSADPDHGARALEELNRDWASAARPEDHQVLALTLRELEEGGLVSGKARVEVLLCIAEARSSRGETARLGGLAQATLELARVIGYQQGLARAYCLSGDVQEAQGKLAAAQSAFGEYLAISRRLAEADPSNAGWQRDLAVGHSRMGDTLQAQGKLAAAQSAFGECLAISRRLAEADPSNAGWQRELAVAHSKVGDTLQAQGKLAAAQSAFGECLAISRRLAEADPSNAGWQRDLAVALSKVGDILQAQGKLAAAQAAFEEYLAISRRLAEADPSNTGWQRDLAVAHSKVGDILQAQGNLAAAQSAFGEYLAISRRLAEADPSNAGWQRDLALAHIRLARTSSPGDNLSEGIQHLREAKRIFDALSAAMPDHSGWRKESEIVTRELAELLARSEAHSQADEP